ncbi:ABC transporter ATP-binding protein [Pusillimonas sp. CC-YST705]|uniref:ABC transporter ATP-binding protein n=1 Tax=Mesopusillimonas faecipullorum TaxID=2755040 RepID=A0ABS8CF94_9BURK|nr:ABC transporter ATP-binding protein [Mesopusillimonas faecipullorum]MCB5364705.1 ABC transporter ATP-binding protein [Mesopusillimonas faecipullorum]
MTTRLLTCENLSAGYGASQVLFGLDFAIDEGEVIGLLGRNGMGKSTTIKNMVGVLKPFDGTLTWQGHKLNTMAPDAIARLGLAVVPEGRQCFPNLTVREHLVAFSSRRNGNSTPWTLKRIYELFPRLAERSRHLGSQLSGGEQQMLAIGRALSTNPKLLILDEATEGLAPLIREEIWRCLGLLKREGQTTLVVDKYVDKLVQIADRHLILERGKLVWSGTSAALDADRSLWVRYMGV